jgi:long-chain acyl-CoA synthetase
VDDDGSVPEPGVTQSIAEVHAQLTAPGQPFEIDTTEIRGVPTRVWKHAPASLPTILDQSRAHGELDFLVYDDERWTFERHFRAAAQVAVALRDRYGVRPGDRVAVAMRNLPEWSVAFWGAAAAGAVVVPLNAWWTGPELAYGLRDSGTTVAFLDGPRLERLTPELAALPDVRVVLARDDGDERTARFEELLDGHRPEVELPVVDVAPEDEATIFYTSGTTGFPKGVLGTHRNICTNLMSLGFVAVRGTLRTQRPEPDRPTPSVRSVSLLSVPFFHATGCHSVLVANLAAGNELVLMRRWDAGRALELIEQERVTTFGGVPAMVWQVLEHPDFERRDLSSLRVVAYGGAPAAPELVRAIEERFPGRTPSNGYGLTETSSVTTMNVGPDYVARPDSVGVPVPVCDVQVVDALGRPLPVGEVGELWIKGPNVVKGYWNQPEESEATFTDGWLHSGDLARIDDDGFVYIVDRAKDLVIRGGENISSVEVEAALFEHPAVTDAAVVGIPHPVLGEEVGAVVHTAPGTTVTADELRRHVGARLAAFKVPVRIWFSEEPLPRNPAGKILKRELKQGLLDGNG